VTRSRALPGELTGVMVPDWARRALRGRTKAAVREAVCAVVDAGDWIAGRRRPLVPPARLRVRVGCFLSYIRLSHYDAVADEFVDHLRALARLRSDSRVLDIGCGCGQMAVPLTRMVAPAGCYDGFDPDSEAIAWCTRHITARFPRFRFMHADLGNSLYNPTGTLDAAAFHFPYPDEAFDLILLKSVFTHLQLPALRNYFNEIRRMLEPGGRVLASFILLNDVSERHAAGNTRAMAFPFDGHGCRLFDRAVPEYKVAYDERVLREVAAECGLTIEAIEYGAWSGRPDFLSFQDLVLFSRPGSGHVGA